MTGDNSVRTAVENIVRIVETPGPVDGQAIANIIIQEIERDRAERQIGASKSQVRRLQHQMDDDLNARGGKAKNCEFCKVNVAYICKKCQGSHIAEAVQTQRTKAQGGEFVCRECLESVPIESKDGHTYTGIGAGVLITDKNQTSNPPPDDLGEMLERLAGKLKQFNLDCDKRGSKVKWIANCLRHKKHNYICPTAATPREAVEAAIKAVEEQ